MEDFKCELAALIGDELLFVSGWAAGDLSADQRFLVGEGGLGDRDVTSALFRYYRGDISGSGGAPLANGGVMALTRPYGGRRGAPSLQMTGGGRPKRVTLTRLEPRDLVDHLYPRYPYFLAAYADQSVASSAVGRALLRSFFEEHPGGVRPSLGHRVLDRSGALALSLELSGVVRRGIGGVLVVSGHVGSSERDCPALRWDDDSGTFSLEAPVGDGLEKLGQGDIQVVTRFVGVWPLATLDDAPNVTTLRVTVGGRSMDLVVPITPPLRSEELAAEVDRTTATAVVESLARCPAIGVDVPAADRFVDAMASSGLSTSELPVVVEASRPTARRVTIDVAFALGDCVVAFGWALDAPGGELLLACHGADGASWNTQRVSCWMERLDVAKRCREAGTPLTDPHVGFLAVFEGFRNSAGEDTDRLYFSIETERSRRSRFRSLRVESDRSDHSGMVGRILARVGVYPPDQWLPVLAPQLGRAWAARPRQAPSVKELSFGALTAEPRVSIVVPLFGRMDLLEYQLACFAGDSTLDGEEILYFVDDPERAEEAIELARRAFALFRSPFRLLVSSQNLGFSGANNRAVEQARGTTLLLLNSDVMPKSPGWLPALHTAYQSLPRPGVLGPRLVFEDGAVQHAGMVFQAQVHGGTRIWFNAHPGKGLSSRLLDKHGIERVHAITGACMMVSADLFRSVGGLSESYIQADFEDSDFCLKLRERDIGSYVLHDVELYHLERQSVSAAGKAPHRSARTFVNAWIHANRWGSVISTLGEGTS
jgi:GT2 family glycosyltransferase